MIMKPRIRITTDEDGYTYYHHQSNSIGYWLHCESFRHNYIWLNLFFRNINRFYANSHPTEKD